MYKTNRVNHNFQIAYFLAGSFHTPDGAYAQMCDLEDDRAVALDTVEVSVLRTKAKRIRLERELSDVDEAVRLEAQASLLELDTQLAFSQKNIDAARAELQFIRDCKARLEPHRLYAHLPLPEAHQAAQAEEWKLELIRRAENCMLTTGTIATDHYATMRLHPEFGTAIQPAIMQFRDMLQKNDQVAIAAYTAKHAVSMQKLLGVSNEIQG